MSIEITMPKLSDTMEEGTILKWRVQEGTHVEQGDVIAEVETDKAAMEMEAFEAGVVRELRIGEGETVSVGTVIAVLATNGEARQQPPAREAAPARPMPADQAKKIAAEAQEKGTEKGKEAVEKAHATEEAGRAQREGAERETTAAEPPIPEPADADRIAAREEVKPQAGLRHEELFVSPAARRLAQEKGVDLRRVRGSGPGGRIVMADVERGAVPPPATPAAREGLEDREARRPPAESPRPSAEGTERQQRPERSVKVRRLVARKMVESWQSIPHFFVTVAVDMTDIIRIRKSLGASINDLIIAAAARSLQDHPWVNSQWQDDEAVEQEKINISIAVATDRGLYNPVLHDCGQLSLKEIGRRVGDLVAKAHAGKLHSEELEGGTFTISNMGMLGVESFSAIITPPQAAVLAVGTVKGEAIVDDKGDPGVAPTVRLTLSADHRVLDGADAADFLASMKSYLEAPVTLITCRHGQD